MEEEIKPVQAPGAIQRNFNSFMLTIAVLLMSYVARTVTSIEITTATNVQAIGANADNISKLQIGLTDQGKILGKLDVRVTRVETIQEDAKPTINRYDPTTGISH